MFTSTGATGTVLATAERTGLGDLDGTWHQVRFDDTGEVIWCHANTLTLDPSMTFDEFFHACERIFAQLTRGIILEHEAQVKIAEITLEYTVL